MSDIQLLMCSEKLLFFCSTDKLNVSTRGHSPTGQKPDLNQ